MKKLLENRGGNCFIPISRMCFIKCNNYFTDKDYTEEFWDFIRNENYRSGVASSARIQPFCIKYCINPACFDGRRKNPPKITLWNISLFLYNKHFCFIRKSKGTSFNQAIEELKLTFKVVEKGLSDQHVKTFVKYEYKPEEVQSTLSNTVVYH